MLINNANFRLSEIPKYHPELEYYERVTFWKEQKRRCVEGYWQQGKWMSGPLYYYINFHNIQFEDDSSVAQAFGLPFLRDIDWELFLIYEECRGFSGFSEDKQYTCDRKFGPEKELALKLGRITEAECKKFTYIDAKEYLRKNHSKSLGKPLYKNSSKHFMSIQARGSGKSYSTSGICAHNFLFDGATDYDDYLERKASRNYTASDTIIGAIDTKYSEPLMKKVKVSLELLAGSFELGDEHYPSPLAITFTGSMHPNKDATSFTGSVLRHRTFKDNPLAANGTRPNLCAIDECFAVGTKIRMFDLSLKNIENIQVGDSVLGIDGKPKIVGKLTSGVTQMYEVKQGTGGITYTTTGNHLLYVEQRCKVKGIPNDGIKLIKTKDFNEENLGKYKYRTTFGVKSGLIEFNNKVELDPYWLGLWLGDGTSSSTSICVNINKDIEIYNFLKDYCNSLNLEFKEYDNNNQGNDKIVVVYFKKKTGKTNPIRQHLQKLNVLNNKHIPNIYLSSSEKDRLNLLAGLIDSDGNINSNPKKTSFSYEICAHNRPELIKNILFLANSLGFDTKLHSKIINKGYDNKEIKDSLRQRIIIKGEIWKIPVKVKRKQKEPWIKTTKVGINRLYVTPTKIDNYYGFTLIGDEEKDHLFLLEDNTIVHNCGFMYNIKESWGAIEATQASKAKKNLVIWALGTGGLVSGKAALYTESIFRNPQDYNCVEFEDIFEHRGKIGYFVPYSKTLNEFKKGPNKETDEALARLFIENKRMLAKKSSDPTVYQTEIINGPMLPSEAFLVLEGSFFPILLLKEQLAEVEGGKYHKYTEASFKGHIIFNGQGEPEFITQQDAQPIRKFPLSRNDEKKGCIEIWVKPQKNDDGVIQRGTYIAGIDVVDKDKSTTDSLPSIVVMNRYTREIVAEYTGRTNEAKDFYEVCRKLLLYYNAIGMYEKNLIGLYTHFDAHKCTYLLADTPYQLRSSDTYKAGTNTAKGINASGSVNAEGRNMVKSWLQEKISEQSEVRVYETIYSSAMLTELIMWNPDGNFDRVSALGMLMWLDSTMFKEQVKHVENLKSFMDHDYWRQMGVIKKPKEYINTSNYYS